MKLTKLHESSIINEEECPVCGGTGDMGFSRFYCSNPDCQNYAPSEKSVATATAVAEPLTVWFGSQKLDREGVKNALDGSWHWDRKYIFTVYGEGGRKWAAITAEHGGLSDVAGPSELLRTWGGKVSPEGVEYEKKLHEAAKEYNHQLHRFQRGKITLGNILSYMGKFYDAITTV